MADLSTFWAQTERQIQMQPMPPEYQKRVLIRCHDCEKECVADFHFIGVQCKFCQGFNTAQIQGDASGEGEGDAEGDAAEEEQRASDVGGGVLNESTNSLEDGSDEGDEGDREGM